MSLIDEELLYRGRVLELTVETHRLPDGSEGDFEIIRHPGGAAALPVDEDGKLLLIRQFRPAARGEILEIPAGRLEPGESPAACIRRELREEIGREPAKVELLNQVYSAVGFCREMIHIYLASDLRVTPMAHDEHEFIETCVLTTDEAFRLVDSGQIVDAKTLIALQTYRQRLECSS